MGGVGNTVHGKEMACSEEAKEQAEIEQHESSTKKDKIF
jgi:hypothetical protein